MNITYICENLSLPDFVGPSEVYESIGHWNTSVLVILALHLIPVSLVSLTFLIRICKNQPKKTLRSATCLVLIPPILMVLASIGIVAPSTGVYVEILHEIVISFGLVHFVSLSVDLCDGEEHIVNYCSKNSIKLPIGSPPFVCLLPAPAPKISRRNLKMMILAPKLLFLYKTIIFCVEIIYTIVGHQSSGDFFNIDNIHNIIGIPVGLLTIYFYTMYNFVMAKVMENKKKFVGVILLLEFILFDCTRIFFIFLTGTGMLQCVPPYLSQKLVEHLMKNYIKAFVATGIGMVMMKMVAENDHEKDDSREGSAPSPASMSSLMSSEDENK